jgi:transcription elongation factor SPT6
MLKFVADLFLKNFLAANPAKSMYGFTLNRKRPGHFSLCFLANKNSTVQTWVCSRRPFYKQI